MRVRPSGGGLLVTFAGSLIGCEAGFFSIDDVSDHENRGNANRVFRVALEDFDGVSRDFGKTALGAVVGGFSFGNHEHEVVGLALVNEAAEAFEQAEIKSAES